MGQAILASKYGIDTFEAVTYADNFRMLEVFHHSGYELVEQPDSGFVTVRFSVRPQAESVARSELRDRLFTMASLRPLLQPRSVAVIGASRHPTALGHAVLQALLRADFAGVVYPVNPKAHAVGGIKAWARIQDLPEAVDLAVITVPSDAVEDAVRACAEHGVRSVLVITAGFAETGAEGKARQDRILDVVRSSGMRMIGPNCLGIINTESSVHLNASFSPTYPPSGHTAMGSQSGALGLALLAEATRRNIGISSFVSMGNKADVSGNDLLQYWEADSNTKAILLYLESFGNPRRFARLARRVSHAKPIVCVKAGRTTAGRRAAGSHTAAMASSEAGVQALFAQTGVLRADTLGEMFDLAAMFGHQPLPRGRRVAVVTNAGGPAILCTDACEGNGLEVVELSGNLQAALREVLPPAASTRIRSTSSPRRRRINSKPLFNEFWSGRMWTHSLSSTSRFGRRMRHPSIKPSCAASPPHDRPAQSTNRCSPA